MNTEKDYFIPSIEDFHVGYEFEFQGIPRGWHKMVLSTENSLKTMQYNIEKLKDAIRVPYLTKEQIEAEGWKQCKENVFEKPSCIQHWIYFLWFHEESSIKKMIEANYVNDNGEIELTDVVYKGPIKSVNELRYLSKLFKI